MKKLCLLLVFALVLTMAAVPSFAEEVTYTQAPMLDALVESSALPPVADRLPDEPFVVKAGTVSYEEYFTDYQVGKYGGTLRSIRNSSTWDGWIWCIFAERAIETVSGEGKDFYGNVFKSWEVSEDFTTYTFHMREGMKWSDGQDLTTEDVAWKFNMDHANAQLTASWPNWLRTGNKSTGNPCTLGVVDDYTFTLTFDGYYPGFVLLVASNDVYELVAPAHYLKDFHVDTADQAELTAKCEAAGYTYEEWYKLYELYDYTSWDVDAENQIGCPSLGAWILTKMDGSTGIFERNPYYWKVRQRPAAALRRQHDLHLRGRFRSHRGQDPRGRSRLHLRVDSAFRHRPLRCRRRGGRLHASDQAHPPPHGRGSRCELDV
jgi:peptide/nickel transport system substrate-binding protein